MLVSDCARSRLHNAATKPLPALRATLSLKGEGLPGVAIFLASCWGCRGSMSVSVHPSQFGKGVRGIGHKGTLSVPLPLGEAGQSHMTETAKKETIRMHLSLIVQRLLPSYAIALPSTGGDRRLWRREQVLIQRAFQGALSGIRQCSIDRF